MTSARHRRKARRWAERQMDSAFEALLAENPTLAQKLSQRAVDAGAVNPRLWFDRSRILSSCGDDTGAEQALRQAIALAPTFAEAFAELAALQAAAGKNAQAVRLQERVVELCPGDAAAREVLARYRARGPDTDTGPAPPPAPAPPPTARTGRHDWEEIEAVWLRDGMALLPGLLSAAECAELRALWDQPCFEYEVTRDDDTEGRAGRRTFSRPLPEVVEALRHEVYARVAGIANALNARLSRADRYPPSLGDFLRRCHEAGQHRPTPVIVRLPAGGFEAPHDDVAGRVAFPLQLAVNLGPGSSEDGGGGELLLVDRRHGRRRRQRRMPTAMGDGVLLCSRERPVEVGGALGLQPVQHAVAPLRTPRFILRVPFHEHG